jgi:hypothetical protein
VEQGNDHGCNQCVQQVGANIKRMIRTPESANPYAADDKEKDPPADVPAKKIIGIEGLVISLGCPEIYFHELIGKR